MKTIGPFRVTISHDPYSPFERGAGRVSLRQIIVTKGETLLPRPPTVLYSEIAGDLAAVLR